METHGLQFVADTSGLAKGFRDYESAVNGVFASLDKFEAHVVKTMKGVEKAAGNKAALNGFRKSLEAFSDVKIDGSAARKISALSSAMNGFKAPSAVQSANLRRFFNAAGQIPNLTQAYRTVKTITDLNTAMKSFKAPAASQAKNLKDFATAVATAVPKLRGLGSVSGISGVANELATIGIALRGLKVPPASQVANLGGLATALKSFNGIQLGNTTGVYGFLATLGRFKAPSQAQTRNLQEFINAVSNLQIPRNAGQIASALGNIARAATAANAQLGGFRTNLGAFPSSFNSFSRGANQASLSMMGLQNAFSGTFQIGSLLRSLLGSLTIGEVGRNFFEASNKAMQFKAAMGVISKEAGYADEQLKYVNETANRFGMDMLTAEESFGKFALSATRAGATLEQTKAIYEGFGTAMSVMGTSADRQKDVMLALQQVMNKGYLAGEELNQQLNEHLPGALGYLNTEIKRMTNGQTTLQDALKGKMIDATQGLLFLAKKYREEFGSALEETLQRPSAQMAILKNRVNELFQKIGEAGANKAFADLLAKISGQLSPDRVDAFANAIGEGLTKAVEKAGRAIDWLVENWDSIKGPLGTTLSLLGKWMIISGALKIGSSIVTPMFQAGQAAGMLWPHLKQVYTWTKAISTVQAVSPLAAGGGAALSGGFQTSLDAINKLKVAMAGINSPAVFSGLRTGFASLSVPIKGVTGAVLGAAGAIAGGLGIAFASGAKAARDSGIQMASDQYSASEIIQGYWMMAMETISGWWQTATDWIAEKTAGMAEIVGKIFGGIADFGSNAFLFIGYVASTVMEGAGRLVMGIGASIIGTLRDIGSVASKLATGDFAGAYQASLKVVTFDAVKGGMGAAFKDFGKGGFAGFKKSVGGGFKEMFDSSMASAGAKARAANTAKPKFDKTRAKAPTTDDLIDAPYDEDKLLSGSGGKGDGAGKKKGGKGPNAAAELNKITNAVDGLMDKLAASNETWKLTQDYIANLTDEARVLLNAGAFSDFSKNLQADMLSGKVSVDDLIKSLEQPGSVSQKALADIKNRYGTDVKGIIEMLRAQQADYEDAVKDGTVKQIEKQMRTVDRVFKNLAEDNPLLKVKQDFMERVTGLGQLVLGKDDFITWFKDLKSGAIDSQSALEDLAIAIDDGKIPTEQMTLLTKVYGLTQDQVAEAIRGRIAANEYLTKQAKEEITFGAVRLRQAREEGILAGMSEKSARLIAGVQEEIRKQREAGNKVTQEMIANYYAEAQAVDNLNDSYARQKEFFENNGVRGYINDVKSAGQAINELDKNFLQSVTDQLVELGTKGTFSFKAIFDTIQQGIVKFAAENVVKTLTEQVFGGAALEGGTPSIFAGLFGKTKLGEYTPEGPKLGTQFNPMVVRVNNMGDLTMGKLGGVGVGDGAIDTGGFSFPTSGGAGTATPAQAESAVATATTEVAGNFQKTMTGMLPLVGMAFASSFKSPILQVAAMFGTMLLQQLLTSNAAGAAGGGGGVGGFLAGLFKEGGMVGSPVASVYASPASFAKAPAYAEGTHNTSGIPAMLHDNEAVIPLSRGRKVPVELTNEVSRGSTNVINNNFTVHAQDADSFRKSQRQIAGDMYRASSRSFQRDN